MGFKVIFILSTLFVYSCSEEDSAAPVAPTASTGELTTSMISNLSSDLSTAGMSEDQITAIEDAADESLESNSSKSLSVRSIKRSVDSNDPTTFMPQMMSAVISALSGDSFADESDATLNSYIETMIGSMNETVGDSSSGLSSTELQTLSEESIQEAIASIPSNITNVGGAISSIASSFILNLDELGVVSDDYDTMIDSLSQKAALSVAQLDSGHTYFGNLSGAFIENLEGYYSESELQASSLDIVTNMISGLDDLDTDTYTLDIDDALSFMVSGAFSKFDDIGLDSSDLADDMINTAYDAIYGLEDFDYSDSIDDILSSINDGVINSFEDAGIEESDYSFALEGLSSMATGKLENFYSASDLSNAISNLTTATSNSIEDLDLDASSTTSLQDSIGQGAIDGLDDLDLDESEVASYTSNIESSVESTQAVTASGDTSLSSGDILLLAEPSGTEGDTLNGGSIIGIGADGSYKGAVVERDAANDVLRYPRGMKFEKHPTTSGSYYLTVGTTNTDLAMEVHRFDETLGGDTPVTLLTPAKITNTDATTSWNFTFAYSENMSGNRYITGKNSDGDLLLKHYYDGGALGTCELDYGDQAGNPGTGWTIGAVYSGMFSIRPPLVARMKNNDGEWAIDSFSHCSTSITEPVTVNLGIISNDDGPYFTMITDVTELFSYGNDWHLNIFLTKKNGLSGSTRVHRYYDANSDGTYVLDDSPFTDYAIAMNWVSNGGSDKKLYTFEEDGDNYYIRRYSADGELETTIFTDYGKSVLNHTVGTVWMSVVP